MCNINRFLVNEQKHIFLCSYHREERVQVNTDTVATSVTLGVLVSCSLDLNGNARDPSLKYYFCCFISKPWAVKALGLVGCNVPCVYKSLVRCLSGYSCKGDSYWERGRHRRSLISFPKERINTVQPLICEM